MTGTNVDISAFAALATGIARLDADLHIVYLNPAFAECTGFAASRLTGRTLVALQPCGTRLHGLAMQARGEAMPTQVRDVLVRSAPGVEARLDFTLTPGDGGVWVEAHAAAPTPAVTRVTESLRGFAHEMRNPLAAISGAAQLLERGARTARERELAHLIRSESARMATLAERLLGSRGGTTTRTVNIHALLEHAAELLCTAHADVAVRRDYDPSLPAWQGDPDRLLQALLNLTRNAVEAHAHHIVLRSRAETGWRDGRGHAVPALRVEVEDDGDGVPEAIARTLFEPMVSGRAGGSGLGLALAREIAREHDGALSYEPRPGGSRFVLRLPRHPRTPEPAP
ncbi:MAG TPA: ATP-binding protein [Rhodanobacteraceae bacterium]